MSQRALREFLYTCGRRHKFRRKNLRQILWPFQGCPTLGNIRNCSTSGISCLLDKKILQKYFNFFQINTSYLKNVINEDCDQHRTALNLLIKKNELESELKNVRSLKSEEDVELEKLAKEEEETLIKDIKVVENEYLELMVPDDDFEEPCEVELKIIPAIGGNEAKLFAEELHTMYYNYAMYKNWEVLVSELRGNKFELRNAFLLVTGDSVMKHLIHEAGIHRVQRVPETERAGRTHTSTCCVSVLPKPNLEDIQIKSTDVVIAKVRSSGPGGQNVNKTETCIQIKHIPTGIRVESQASRHQAQNLKDAFNKLRAILRENMESKVQNERAVMTKEQIKTGDYSDKIRTYNFPQNRITDHRINFSMHNMKDFLLGDESLDLMISKVAEYSKKEKLLRHILKVLDSTEYKEFEKSQKLKQTLMTRS